MCLDDVVAIEEGHFASSLDPDLVLGVLGHDIETGDAESELAGFGELSDVDACAQELLFGDVGAQ